MELINFYEYKCSGKKKKIEQNQYSDKKGLINLFNNAKILIRRLHIFKQKVNSFCILRRQHSVQNALVEPKSITKTKNVICKHFCSIYLEAL